MDLGTIRKRLDTNYYRTFRSFHDDVELVFKNALRYNPPDSQVSVIIVVVLLMLIIYAFMRNRPSRNIVHTRLTSMPVCFPPSLPTPS